MISRIVNPKEFFQCIDDLEVLFRNDDQNSGHFFLRHDKESIKSGFGNSVILHWDVFVWANKNDNGKYDAAIIFVNEKSLKFNCRIFAEFLWLSKNHKCGLKLLKAALDFAKQNKFSVVSMNTVVQNPSFEKLKRLYGRLGFVKDSESYLLSYE